jgi:hypothetical protein
MRGQIGPGGHREGGPPVDTGEGRPGTYL